MILISQTSHLCVSKTVFQSPSSTQSVSLEWKNVEIPTLTQTQIDFQIFLLPKLVPACSKFSQIRGSLKVIPSWKNIIFEHEVQTCSEDWRCIIRETHTQFSLTLHLSFGSNIFYQEAILERGRSLLAFLQLGGLQVLPVKAASVLSEENLRVISCLCLWMSRCSSVWKRWSKK